MFGLVPNPEKETDENHNFKDDDFDLEKSMAELEESVGVVLRSHDLTSPYYAPLRRGSSSTPTHSFGNSASKIERFSFQLIGTETGSVAPHRMWFKND